MRGIYTFVVKPKGERYNNAKKIGNKELILNTEISSHKFTNRQAVVKAVPIAIPTEIKVGDTVIVHHNVFRRWHNVQGVEKNSGCYFNEDTYILNEDQIFAYNNGNGWRPLKGYCFIQPLKDNNKLFHKGSEKLRGIVVYSDVLLKKIV